VLIGVDQFRSVICLILQVVEHTFLDYLLKFLVFKNWRNCDDNVFDKAHH